MLRARALVAPVLLLLLSAGCPRERTAADVVEERRASFDAVADKVRKIRTLLETLPPYEEPGADLGALPPPRFAAPPSLPGDSIALMRQGLDDLAVVPEDPLRVGERASLHHLASFLTAGVDLDGHALLPVDTIEGWFGHVEGLRFLLVVDLRTWETPSYIMDTLIPGKAEGQVVLFDLTTGRPKGGAPFRTVSVPPPPEAPRPSAVAMTEALRRDTLLAIRKALGGVLPGMTPPFEAQLAGR